MEQAEPLALVVEQDASAEQALAAAQAECLDCWASPAECSAGPHSPADEFPGSHSHSPEAESQGSHCHFQADESRDSHFHSQVVEFPDSHSPEDDS